MIFILGLLGILQITLVPGLILYRLLNDVKSQNFWLALPQILSLSFIFNFFLVFGLTALHLYLPSSLRLIFALELVLLAVSYPLFFKLPLITGNIRLRDIFPSHHDMIKQSTNLWLLLLLLFLLLWIYFWQDSWGQVFGLRDPAVSYNVWAVAWAHNQFPILTWHYPQLLPANWSIAYVMMGPLPQGVVLEMFPATLNLLFPILMTLVFFNLFKSHRNTGYLIAGSFTSLFMLNAFIYIHNGHMDWVAAFLNFLSLSMVYEMSASPSQKLHWRSYLQILLFTAAAALSKPSGLYAAFFLPWLIIFAVKPQSLSKLLLSVLLSYVILIALISPWYLYAQIYEINNQHTPIADLIFLIWDIFRINSWLAYAAGIFNFGPWVVLLLAGSLLFSNALPRVWRLCLYFYAPYFLIWAVLYSYDNRNLSLLYPILATTTGLIVHHYKMDISFCTWVRQNFYKLNRLWLMLLVLIAFAGLVALQPSSKQKALIEHDINTKNQIYDVNPGVVTLVNYARCPGFKGKIFSSMLIFGKLPALSPYVIEFPPQDYGPDMLPSIFNSPELLQQRLSQYPDVRYFLIDERFKKLTTSEATRNLLKTWEAQGKIKTRLNEGGIHLYEVMVPLNQLSFKSEKASL